MARPNGTKEIPAKTGNGLPGRERLQKRTERRVRSSRAPFVFQDWPSMSRWSVLRNDDSVPHRSWESDEAIPSDARIHARVSETVFGR